MIVQIMNYFCLKDFYFGMQERYHGRFVMKMIYKVCCWKCRHYGKFPSFSYTKPHAHWTENGNSTQHSKESVIIFYLHNYTGVKCIFNSKCYMIFCIISSWYIYLTKSLIHYWSGHQICNIENYSQSVAWVLTDL